jgi:hypothetical protein
VKGGGDKNEMERKKQHISMYVAGMVIWKGVDGRRSRNNEAVPGNTKMVESGARNRPTRTKTQRDGQFQSSVFYAFKPVRLTSKPEATVKIWHLHVRRDLTHKLCI